MIIGLTGHQALPAAVADYVDAELRRLLADLSGEWVGLCSLAEGADQMFASQVLAAGGRLRVVIPCCGFVDTLPHQSARERFQALVGSADQVVHLDFPEPSEEAYFAAGRAVVEGCDALIAVWDGKAARGLGGTADIVHHARAVGKPVQVIWLAGAER